MKTYLIRLPLELHTTLKIAAAKRNVSMMDFIIEAIKEKIQRMD